MKWEKMGLIYKPNFDGSWKHSSGLTPTPILLNNDAIRVYTGFRDPVGVSRIGYVDIEADNPSKIIKISETPVLDIGQDGCFDDNGVILGDVIRVDNKIYMYYVGFQLVNKVKFLAFTGLAISNDNGETFKRIGMAPVLDRTNEALYIRAVHSVIYDGNKFRVWCGVGSSWNNINGTPYPSYNIRYYESYDGICFDNKDKLCLDFDYPEYRIGRPRVYQQPDGYAMYFTWGTVDGRYEMGYATSLDGVSWERADSNLGIDLSATGWDSKSLSYGAIIKFKEKTYMFYNGNNMGHDGFGYARMIS